MHILETAKTKHFICLQFRDSNQTKKTLLSNFGNYSEDHHFTVNGGQNLILCDIIKVWKKIKKSSFSHKFVVKIHFKIRAISKISLMGRQSF